MSKNLSKIPINIKIINKGEACGILDRLKAPLTVESILNILPINARITPSLGYASILIGIKRGVEKPVNKVNAGTIAYWPRGDSLCIYPENSVTNGPVNIIGEIHEGIHLFSNLRSGSRIIIEKNQSPGTV